MATPGIRELLTVKVTNDLIIPQTLNDAGESEVLVLHMIKNLDVLD